MNKRTFILASAAAAAVICAPRATFADQPDWTQYKESFNVKFSGYAGSTTLTNFPALIRLSAALNGFDYTKCADGADLRFSDADGNLIPHEIDTWNAGGESLVWVQVPELTSTTIIKTYYGYKGAAGTLPAVTATDVWTNGYVAVWHMKAAEGTFTQRDSTTTGKNIAPNSSYRAGILCGVEGAVGRAAELGRDGVTTGGFGVADNGDVLDGFSALTLEAWTFQTAYSSVDAYLFMKKVPNPYTLAYDFFQRVNSSGRIGGYAAKNDAGDTANVWQGTTTEGAQLNEWTHQVFRWNGTTGQNTGFLNGVSVFNSVADSRKGDGRKVGGWLFIGNTGIDQWGTSVFPGKIDEVRISSVARSDNWVVASHDTIANDDFAIFEAPNDWTQYAHKFSVTFPGVEEGATLDDFPVLVKVSEADIPGFSYADCAKEGGADLRFTDGNGTTPLPCEVEVWDTNGVSLVWVKVPTLTKGTRITGYYGWNLAPAVNSTEVWDANFVGVWHMNSAEGKRTQYDATANIKHVTCPADYADAIQSGVEGKIGLAARCGLRDDRHGGFGISDSGHFDTFGAITIEAWTFRDEGAEQPTTANRAIVEKSSYSGDWLYGWSMYEQQNSEKVGCWFYSDANTGGKWMTAPVATPTQGEWHYHARRWSGVTGVNSRTLDASTTSSNPAPPATPDIMRNVPNGELCIGNRSSNVNGTGAFPGVIDEVRISNVFRSDAWVKATYDTIADNATFTRYGVAGDNVNGTVILFK